MGAHHVKPLDSSTRSVTRETGTFTRATAGSQSLARGLALLRAFRPGTGALSNAELAERTGLPRSTVSRLTRVLVDSGFLIYDIAIRAYRLSAVYLSLANTYRYQIPAVDVALPLLKSIALDEKLNVGLAIGEHDEMVYLASFRESRRGVSRRADAGSRFPMDVTAAGRAYLAAISCEHKALLMRQFSGHHAEQWPTVCLGIDDAARDIAAQGYCSAHWQPGLTAIATFLVAPDGQTYSIGIGFHAEADERNRGERRYAPVLLKLKDDISAAWQTLPNNRTL